MAIVGEMAAQWNLPIIGYMTENIQFANKTLYNTLASLSIMSIESLSDALAQTIRQFQWANVGHFGIFCC